MKTPEDVINRFINEENVKFNQECDDWMIEAMKEYAEIYHESMVKKLHIPAVIKSVCVCGRELDAMDLQVAQCYECSRAVPQTVL
jgi:hypothetical protein